ncbi:MAG: PAC2 family protein [Nitrososphaerales archaeon]|nr:PAC2 family protein [Nitrososphaerales archaeon]
MWIDFKTTGRARFRNPSLLVAVSTSIPQYKALYSQARELAKHLLKSMKFEEVAVVRSSAFPPEVIVDDDGISVLPSCRFYLHRGKKDLLLFAGDSSPMDDQYTFTKILLDFAKKAGVKELLSVGARWSETPQPQFQDPELKGFATDKEGVKKLKRFGVKLTAPEPAPFFASMVVGVAKDYGIRGYKIGVDHGEPMPHTRSVIKMLEAASAMFGFKAELEELRSQVKGPPQVTPPGTGAIYQ